MDGVFPSGGEIPVETDNTEGVPDGDKASNNA